MSPDGQYVAFQRASTKSETGTQLSSSGRTARACMRSHHLHRRSSDMHPNWIADGKTIVFSSDRTGHFELYMVNVDEGPTPQPPSRRPRSDLHEGSRRNLEPASAPEWKSIFVRHQWNVFGEIPSFPHSSTSSCSIRAHASDLSDTDPGLGKSDCQPPGPATATRSRSKQRVGKEDIYVVDRKGNGLRRITSLTSNEFHPSWASLGSQLLISDRTGATGGSTRSRFRLWARRLRCPR